MSDIESLEECGFYRLQTRLRAEGWYFECTDATAGGHAWEDMPMNHQEGPFKGMAIDLSKCLISFLQDPFDELEYPEDMSEEECEEMYEEVAERLSQGDMDGVAELTGQDWVKRLEDPSPENLGGNEFMFSSDGEGLSNLKEILHLIEECGCSYELCDTDSVIDIRWD